MIAIGRVRLAEKMAFQIVNITDGCSVGHPNVKRRPTNEQADWDLATSLIKGNHEVVARKGEKVEHHIDETYKGYAYRLYASATDKTAIYGTVHLWADDRSKDNDSHETIHSGHGFASTEEAIREGRKKVRSLIDERIEPSSE